MASKTSIRKNISNNITKLLFAPCSDTPLVAFELASAAFVRAGISVISPDPKEIYHKVTGEPIVHTIRQGAKDILAEAEIDAEKEPLIRGLGRLLGRFDRFVWWFFILNSLEDGLVDATSQFIKMTPCLNPNFFGDGFSPFGGIFGDGRWSGIDYNFPPGSNYYPAVPLNIRLNAANSWRGTIMAQATFQTTTGIEKPVSSRIVFIPDSGAPMKVIDQFSNADSHHLLLQKNNVAFAHYQGAGGEDGILTCQFAYFGDSVPDNELIPRSGSCYISGGGGGH